MACGWGYAEPETTEIPIQGDRLSGIVIPVLPRASSINIAGLGAHAWTVNDTKRLLVQRDVVITIGSYTFESETAVVWINRMPTDAGVVSQIAVYLPTFAKSSNHGGFGAAGENLLVVGSTLGMVTMDVALLEQYKPTNELGLISHAESRLAGYFLGLGGSSTEISSNPVVMTAPKPIDPTSEEVSVIPIQEVIRPWLKPKSGFVGISADHVVLQPGETENIITATGNILLEYRSKTGIDDMNMTATRCIFFLDPGSVRDIASGKVDVASIHGVYLEGNVVINANHGKNLVRAPQIYYDFDSSNATMLEATLRTYVDVGNGQAPLYIRADRLRQVAANQWVGEDVQVSTSAFATPDFSIGTKKIAIEQTEEGRTFIKSTHNTMRLGGYPVMYWPYFQGEAHDIPLHRVKFGFRDTLGMMIETRWDLFSLLGKEEPEGISTDLRIDGYEDRGAGVGIDFTYQVGSSLGSLEMYLLSDSGTQKTNSGRKLTVPKDLRGHVLWSDENTLDQYWTIQTQLSYISDPTYMSVWEQSKFQNHNEFETGFYAKKQVDNSAFTALATYDLNQFISTSWLLASRQYKVDKLPEIGFYRYGDSLFNGALNWSSETRLIRERLSFQTGTPTSLGLLSAAFAFPNGTILGSNENIADPLITDGLTENHRNRFVTRHELTVPLQIGDVKIVPFASIQAQWGFSPDDATDGEETTQWLRTLGFRASTQLHRIFNDVDNSLFDLHRLRHVIEPYATLWDGDSNINPDNLDQYDAQVDNLSTGTLLWLGMKNRLQTWRGGPGRWYQVDWLTLDSSIVFASDGATQRYDNPQYFNWRPEYSSIEDSAVFKGTWQLSDAIVFVGNGTWELDGGAFSRGTLGVELDHGKDVRVFVEYREIGNSNDRYVSLGMSYDLSKRYSIQFTPSWNFNTDDLQSLRLAVTRHYPDFDLLGQITYNEILDETQYGFGFNLLKF
jgi:hypothetical protein